MPQNMWILRLKSKTLWNENLMYMNNVNLWSEKSCVIFSRGPARYDRTTRDDRTTRECLSISFASRVCAYGAAGIVLLEFVLIFIGTVSSHTRLILQSGPVPFGPLFFQKKVWGPTEVVRTKKSGLPILWGNKTHCPVNTNKAHSLSWQFLLLLYNHSAKIHRNFQSSHSFYYISWVKRSCQAIIIYIKKKIDDLFRYTSSSGCILNKILMSSKRFRHLYFFEITDSEIPASSEEIHANAELVSRTYISIILKRWNLLNKATTKIFEETGTSYTKLFKLNCPVSIL